MLRTFMAALLAVPLLVLPSPPTAPVADLTALEGVAARLKTAQPWADTARASATTAPTAVTRYYLDTKRGVVAVGVEKVTPALTAAARETFGNSMVLHQADRMHQASRVNDAAPHRGGAEVSNSALRAACTSGFAVNRPGAATPVALLTAGHCARGIGDAFTNNGRQVGTVVQRERANGSLDAALIGASAQATIYTGGRTSSATARVAGTADVSFGDTVCISGAITAENCTGTLIGTSLCIVFQDSGNETCELDLVESPDGRRLSDRGDSGAPVYVYTGTAVNAVGMIVGSNGNGSQAAYHSMDTVLGFFGATLMTR